MRETKRLRIIVKRRKVLAMDRFNSPCAQCGREVETLTREETARFLEIDLEAVESLAAAGRIHAIYTATGGYRLCKPSLLQVPK